MHGICYEKSSAEYGDASPCCYVGPLIPAVQHPHFDRFSVPDALERERLTQHGRLRELVSRGDVVQLKAALAALGSNADLVVNLTPGAANTLLYTACEAGLTSVVGVLLEAGADGRAHAITKYGPLYVACYQGHLEIAKMLLVHFPRAVQQETVEKWLPLHAACIGGHASLVTLLLEYPYPQDMLYTYTSANGERQYRAAFDINARDASGQTALFVACSLANMPVVNALLDHTVQHAPAQSERPPSDSPEPTTAGSDASKALSPQRSISLGIHAIVSKLTGGSGNKQDADDSSRLSPVCVDAVVNGESCVSLAVRANNARLLKRLLKAGAKADAPAAPPLQRGVGDGRELRRRSRSASAAVQRNTSVDRSCRDGDDRDGWSALRLAARLSFVPLAEMLLDAGATDPSGRAASEAANNNLNSLLARILATKAYPDPEYKLDKSAISAAVLNSRAQDNALTYNARCPSTPVMITWRELRCKLPAIRMSWLRGAAMHVNPRLVSPAGALLAVTRVDVANNELRQLPPDLFTLLSLKYLNAAQNKLERLPQEGDPFEEEPPKGRGKRARPKVYSAPSLQEIYLQDNRLEELPPSLFLLPSLQTLDVSNNKLRSLPSSMWRSPSLRDLCAALNHLRDLPLYQEPECSSPVPQSPCDVSSANSSVCEQSTEAAVSHSSSRSPSIEGDTLEDEDAPVTIANRAENTVCTPVKCAHSWRGEVEPEISSPPPSSTGGSCLQALSLAHNQLTCVPPALACLAPALTRLNLAYNSLRSMSYVTSYPTGLRQLDLSHNEITCWPSLPQIDTFGSVEGDPLTCYCPQGARVARPRPRSGASTSTRSLLLSAACPARRHLRLDALRTLILSNNLLTKIQLTTDDDDGLEPEPRRDDDEEWDGSGTGLRSRLVFPLLSMLDVSCNMLRQVPPAIHALANLAVLNISGNKEWTVYQGHRMFFKTTSTISPHAREGEAVSHVGTSLRASLRRRVHHAKIISEDQADAVRATGES
ncbi:hypothetical protein evm_009254 [Chilo suppressalis]|nr:hypothetical protein evm_009254 [Chilo suppressalis]